MSDSKPLENVLLTTTVVNALELSASRRQQQPLGTLGILLGILDVDVTGDWDSVQLRSTFLSDADVARFEDPDREAAGKWLGVPLTGTATNALRRAAEIANRYRMMPMPTGVLALGLLSDQASAACKALLEEASIDHAELLDIVQGNVLDVHLEGFDAHAAGNAATPNRASAPASPARPKLSSVDDRAASSPDPRATSLRRSAFLAPTTFQVIATARSWLVDLRIAGCFAAACLVGEAILGGPHLSTTLAAETHGLLRWLVVHDAARYFPTIVATFVLVVMRRLGKAAHLAFDLSRRRLLAILAAGIATVLLAGVYLAAIPGTTIGRFVPLGLALLVVLRVGRWEMRQRLRTPTTAGFRPPLRSFLGFRRYITLHNCAVALPKGPFISTNIVDSSIDDGIAVFHARGDIAAEAYVRARGIEYLLEMRRIADAEARARDAIAAGAVATHPATLSAYGLFLQAVGLPDEALARLREARERCGVRVPAGLRALIAQIAVEVDSDEQERAGWHWTEMQRARMAWHRRPGTVMLGLAGEIRALARDAPDDALTLARKLASMPHVLDPVAMQDALPLTEAVAINRAAGLALMTIASVCEARGKPLEAGAAYTNAFEEFSQIKDKARAAVCLVRGFSRLLEAGYDDAVKERHALDMIRIGLQLLENDRGTLRGDRHRAAWVQQQMSLYAQAFEVLTRIRWHEGRAAELGLWLLESLHRTSLSGLVRSKALTDDTSMRAALNELAEAEVAETTKPEGAQKLHDARQRVMDQFVHTREVALVVDPTDVEAALRRIGDRTALLYQCWREESRWVIHSVLVSGGAPVTVRRYVHNRLDDQDEWLSVTGFLDALASGRPDEVSAVFGVPLFEDVWRDIAAAVFPPQLSTMLPAPNGVAVSELLIVPDGPLANLPFAGLPLPDGRRLIDAASVALVPSLSLLDEPLAEESREPARVVVTHLDDRALAGARAEMAVWNDLVPELEILSTQSREELEEALRRTPAPDVAVISAHGDLGDTTFDNVVNLRDGSVISAAAALELDWPAFVILGSCWLAGVDIGVGREPFGFPVACLLRGAIQVTGSLVPAPDAELSRVLSALTRRLPMGGAPGANLREAVFSASTERPQWRDAAPRDWAALATWSIAPTTRRQNTSSKRQSYWKTNGVPRSEVDPPAELAGILANAPRRSAAVGQSRKLRLTRRWAWGIAVATLAIVATFLKTAQQDQAVLNHSGFLGVKLTSSAGLPPTVDSVLPGSPAAHAGLHPGEQIVSVEGLSVETTEDAIAAIRSRGVGARIRLGTLENGHETELTVTLVSVP